MVQAVVPNDGWNPGVQERRGPSPALRGAHGCRVLHTNLRKWDVCYVICASLLPKKKNSNLESDETPNYQLIRYTKKQPSSYIN